MRASSESRVLCGAIDIDGDVHRDRTEGRGVFGGEPDAPAAGMRERRALSNDEVDQPGSARVARADLDGSHRFPII